MEIGIYSDCANVYAPFYRQAAMKVYMMPEEEREKWLGAAYRDISAAFSWYLEHENGGRPIILAGFSQGADMCLRLMAEYFSDEALLDRLVATYAIGWPCGEELVKSYPWIRPAAAGDDIGVVVSFDCESPEVDETFINPAGKRAFSINPLNWRTDSTPADKSENLGACFTDYSGEILSEAAGLCGCYIDEARGALKVTDVDPADYPALVPGLPEGSYHVYDYQFFYRNLEENVSSRVDAYLSRESAAIPDWNKDSEAMRSIMDYVDAVCDPQSDLYVDPAGRVAVFDLDGTLIGERFPTYFDVCLFLHRALHDPSYTAAEDVAAYAAELERALKEGLPEPDSPRSTAQMEAECFAGMSVDEYRAYVRAFMDEPAAGFSGMTYAEGFFRPMVSLVEYLSDNGFTVFVSSGTERVMARELIARRLGDWIPPYCVIGSDFTMCAANQDGKEGRSYTYAPDDEVLMEGNLAVKNQKANKVFSIVSEIGVPPVIVFGNSSGDLAMAEYCMQHGGRAYMLLCDDTERDYGDPDEAAAFAEECVRRGIETISMRDEFDSIYGNEAVMTEGALEPAA